MASFRHMAVAAPLEQPDLIAVRLHLAAGSEHTPHWTIRHELIGKTMAKSGHREVPTQSRWHCQLVWQPDDQSVMLGT